MSTVREHLGLLWLMRRSLMMQNPQDDRHWELQAAFALGVHLDEFIALAGGADIEEWVAKKGAKIPADFPYAATKAAAPAIVPQGVAKLLHKLRDEGVLSEGQITQALGVDRLTCREILDGDFVAAAPDDAPKSATFEDWLASEIKPPSGDLTPQQRVIAYAKLAFEAGRAAPAPDTGIPTAGEVEKTGWISVDDDLPEPGERVLVTRFAGRVGNAEHPGHPGVPWVEVTRYMVNCSMFECDLLSTGNVTHWMRVDAAPSHPSEAQTCTYPKCNCPMDAPSDPNWCARGLARAKAGEDA